MMLMAQDAEKQREAVCAVIWKYNKQYFDHYFSIGILLYHNKLGVFLWANIDQIIINNNNKKEEINKQAY